MEQLKECFENEPFTGNPAMPMMSDLPSTFWVTRPNRSKTPMTAGYFLERLTQDIIRLRRCLSQDGRKDLLPPRDKDISTSGLSAPSARGIEPLAGRKMDVDPLPLEPPVIQEVVPTPSSSSTPSCNKDPLMVILSVRRKRGKTNRQRVFFEGASFIRMHSKKITNIANHFRRRL
ncbi:hypothetical protein J6590_094440 [Homalodisca vitripennis]|nr:hypothetical protein J6590_094440 [Homalodisca vitripennis]